MGGKMGSDGGGCDCSVDGGTGGTGGSSSDTTGSDTTGSRCSSRCDDSSLRCDAGLIEGSTYKRDAGLIGGSTYKRDAGLIGGSTSMSTYERVRGALPGLLGDAFTYTVRPWEGGDKIRLKRMTSVFVDVFTLRRYI